ncbi:MAG: hypothetical protein L6R42_001153 [Xanthoria sp. 1 TBL-2021]|nr:MAG: hypothetical protein L6R42_001153 [Xanthoria sp. 1 TBL-2021]
MNEKGKHALVFGASGLIGWGIVDQLLSNYPSPGTFAKVTALVNRPLDVQDSFWPLQVNRPLDVQEQLELQLVSGINLADGSIQSVTELLRTKVKGIEHVTHVFYFVYKYEEKPEEEVRVVCGMLERAVAALDHLSPKMEFLVFPTGTKAYGIHIPGGVFKAPYKESMGALPNDFQKTLNYPFMRAILEEASAGKQWTWCDIRPDAVIGFVPNGSAFNLTAHWATYLSLYRLIEGPNAKVPFPGSLAGYNALYNEASADIIAKLAIWASLHPAEAGGGQIFNISDQAKPESMRDRWPRLAAYFGLQGVAPVEGEVLKPSEYINRYQGEAEKLGVKSSPVFKGEFLDSYGFYLDFDRQLSLEKVRKAGFAEEMDPNASWFRAFGRFKEARMIVG